MSKYDDIIGLPHFHDLKRGFMSMSDRAAQFSAYKALNGYEDSIESKSESIWEDDDWKVIDFSESQIEGEFDLVDEEFDD